MKVQSVFLCVGVVFWCAWAGAQAPDLEHLDIVLKSVPDGPVAKVYGQNISAQEFVNLYKSELTSVAMQAKQTEIPDEVRIGTALQCLALLVQREVLYHEALQRKLTVSDEELAKEWKSELERIGSSMSDGKGSVPDEAQLLKQAGVTREEALADVRKEMLIGKVREQIVSEHAPQVSDKEVSAYFQEKKALFKRPDQYHLEQLFMSFGPDGDKAAPEVKRKVRERIEKALKRVQAGENFQTVVKDVSEAPDKASGGDLGMLPASALPPFYVEAAAKMQPGRISGIIESEYGYHIIKLVAYEPGQDATLEKAAPLIRKMLTAKKSTEVVDAFCDPILNEKGVVQVYLELDKTIATHPDADKLRQGPSEKKTPKSK